jgi:hypothetical protein
MIVAGIIGYVLGVLSLMALRVVLFRLMVMSEMFKIENLKNKYEQWRTNL